MVSDTGGVGTNPGASYTWTCSSCPAWGERYWSTSEEAVDDPPARAHATACPGGGGIVVVHRPAESPPERLGAERIIGTYDPDEPLIVPYWAVLVARGLAGLVARHADRGATVNLADDNELQLVVGALLAANPLPDAARPTDHHSLARTLRHLADTIAGSLPKP